MLTILQVVITLIADHDTIPKRSLFLDESKSIVHIGRASKVSAKGFVAARDNAWFDSPVMSRRHAEFHANLEQKVNTDLDRHQHLTILTPRRRSMCAT
jgi:hypothetical protein